MHFFTANIIDTNLLHDALCVRAQRERERERERVGLFGMRSGFK